MKSAKKASERVVNFVSSDEVNSQLDDLAKDLAAKSGAIRPCRSAAIRVAIAEMHARLVGSRAAAVPE